MENYAQDAGAEEQIIGVAYLIQPKAYRYQKRDDRPRKMMMRMEMVGVSDDEGNDVGSICSDMKGGVIFVDNDKGELWHVSAKELWDAYIAMRDTIQEQDK